MSHHVCVGCLVFLTQLSSVSLHPPAWLQHWGSAEKVASKETPRQLKSEGMGEKKKWPQGTGPLGAARKETETLGTHEPCKYPVEGNAVPPSLTKLQGFRLQRLQYQSLPKGIITQVCGGPLCPVLLEVMLHRPVLTQEDARVRLNRRSERLLFSMALFHQRGHASCSVMPSLAPPSPAPYPPHGIGVFYKSENCTLMLWFYSCSSSSSIACLLS